MESILIEAVQMHPCLYDKNKRDYRNKKQKEEAWAAVAEESGESGKQNVQHTDYDQNINNLWIIFTVVIIKFLVERCQHRWRSLRDRYVRELMIKSKTGSTSGTRWVFMDALSFLENHVAPYRFVKFSFFIIFFPKFTLTTILSLFSLLVEQLQRGNRLHRSRK